MIDPLSDIENEKAQIDMGTTTYRIYKGARQDGATQFEAFLIVAAFWYGQFKGVTDQEEEEEK